MGNCTRIKARIGDGPTAPVKEFTGRPAWALNLLVLAGPEGCTPITHPGPRWSDYVFKLRRAGVGIDTEHEAHHGDFAGHHARYRLSVPVAVLDVDGCAP
jgi:hypothetical protein